MRKKFLGALMLGLVALGTTSTITSCKDYDSDISSLKDLTASNKALIESTKTALENQISSLKTELAAQIAGVQADILALQNDLGNAESAIASNSSAIAANTSAIAANTSKIAAAEASIAALETRIKTAEEALADLKLLVNEKVDKSEFTAKTQELMDLIKANSEKIAANSNLIAANDAAIKANTAAIATKVSQSDFDAAVTAIYARIETVETGLADALKKIQTNADNIAANASNIAKNASAIDAANNKISILTDGLNNEVTARAAADANLQDQIDALKGYYDAIKALVDANKIAIDKNATDIANNATAIGNNASAISANGLNIEKLQSQVASILETLEQAKKEISGNSAAIDALTGSVATNKLSIEALTTKMNDLCTTVTSLQDEVNVLNILVKRTLRSLVFQPDLYYWGVEGTKLLTLNCKVWDLEATAWNHVESVFKASHPYYEYAETFRVLDFTANYHMNPSTADKSLIKDVKVISDDKDFYDDGIHTRAAACGLYVANWDAANGMLNVNLGVQDKALIKNVASDKQITVFAAQAQYGDTTITSDYATLIKEEVNNLYLYHHDAKHGAPTTYGIANTHCGTCEINAELLHLFKTPYEASYDFLPQDSCNWNETLDLRKLVGTHYFTSDGVEKDFDIAKYGLSYKFELTGLYLEGNKTSESAHAAINPTDGYTFKPQMPIYDAQLVGTQQTYEKGVQGRQTIGRTPLVRVSLVDAKGTVYAYGYIRIKITEPSQDAPIIKKDAKYITYDTNVNYVYNQECTYPAWSYQTTWIQTEYDIYNMVKNSLGGITREEFEAIYTPDYISGTEFRQYALKTAGKAQDVPPVYEENVKVTYYDGGVFATQTNIGTVNNIVDASLSEDGTRTSIIKWSMTGAQAYKLFVTNKKTSAQTAVRYISSKTDCPDVYVVLNTGTATVTYPSAKATWSADIISNYWYSTDSNTGKSGTDEIHAQVLTPEDAPTKGKTVADFSDMFSDVFYGNFSNGLSKILAVENASAANKLRVQDLDPKYIDFIFAAKNNGLVFNGVEKQYKMSVADNGKTLKATIVGTTSSQKVATIVGTNYKSQYVKLEETAYAKDLLNYKAHNDLVNAIYAVIGLAPVKPCTYSMTIDGTFNVRFLRPLNVKSKDAVVEDANIEKVQDILMKDLVVFNDWRDAWDHKDDTWGPYTYDAAGNATEYSKYYDIKYIKVQGVADGDNLSQCAAAKTNLGLADDIADDESKWVTLASVSKQVDFVYNEPSSKVSTHYLRYRNLSSTLSVCKVKVPVVVGYYWGELKGYAYITIYGSHHNAAK